MSLHKVTCIPRGHTLGFVRICLNILSFVHLKQCDTQTSQLPEDDNTSVTYKQFLATIDVCMGGRVAEELSKLSFPNVTLP
jgi:ATP-dependent metalloprotease